MSVAAEGLQVGIGLAKTIEGLVNAHKTKEEAAQLKKTHPTLGRDAIADENLALAKSELSNGMSSKAEKAYNDISDRQFSSSLSSILKGGGDINSVGDIYGKSEEGRQRLSTMQDELRLAQINNVLKTSAPVEERDAQMFQFNKWMPWADSAQANAAARTGAQNQIWSGLETAGAAGMQFAQNKFETDQYDKILGLGKYATRTPQNNRTAPEALTVNSSTVSNLPNYAPPRNRYADDDIYNNLPIH